MARDKTELLPGTLHLLVLNTLLTGPRHGYAIARRIQQTSEDVLVVEEGSLYPALHRMEKRGWITSEWGVSEANRRAKFYKLTRSGRARLKSAEAEWQRYAGAIERVLAERPEGA